MTERNVCLENGCQAACCKNVYIQMTEEDYGKFCQGVAPMEETDLETIQMAISIMGLGKRAQFHYQYPEDDSYFPGRHIVCFFNTSCPHLGSTNMCDIYEQRPVGCRELSFQSARCQEVQNRF